MKKVLVFGTFDPVRSSVKRKVIPIPKAKPTSSFKNGITIYTRQASNGVDGLHAGHINFLKQAKKYGDFLVAVVGRDKTVKKLKKQLPQFSERERLKKIKESGLVDEVLLGGLASPYAIIKKIKPDIICLGYDQKFFIEGLPAELKKMGLKTKIHRMKPYKPKIFHTSKLRKNQI